MTTEDILFDGKGSLKAYSSALWMMGLFSIVTIGIGLIITIPMFIKIWLEVKTTYYKISSKRIQIEKGLLSTTINSLELWRIKDLKYQRNLFEKLTDGCTLSLMTQDVSTPDLNLKGFTANEGRTLFDKLQNAVSNARRTNGTVSLTS